MLYDFPLLGGPVTNTKGARQVSNRVISPSCRSRWQITEVLVALLAVSELVFFPGNREIEDYSVTACISFSCENW